MRNGQKPEVTGKRKSALKARASHATSCKEGGA